MLSALRPAVVAMIGSAGMSILMLALFNTSFYNISLAALRPIELILFAGSLFLLRRFHGKVGAVSIILGSGAVGTLAYVPVSYTHLDVYKRQAPGRRRLHSGSAGCSRGLGDL